MIEPFLVFNLLDAIYQDLLGGLIAEYTDTMGPIFWVFVTLAFTLPLVNRIGILPVAIIIGMWWGTLLYILPAVALNIGMAIMALAGMSILVVLFFARRRQYG